MKTLTDLKAQIEQAEKILSDVWEDDRELTYPEQMFFRTELGYNDKQLKNEKRRVNSKMQLQAIAGTTDDRTALAKEVERSAKALATKRPKLQQEIDELSKQLRSLERDAAQSEKRSNEASEAVEKLRACVPPTIQAEYDTRKRALNESIRRELFDCETEIKAIETALKLDGNNPDHLDKIRLHRRPGKQQFVTQNQVTPAWGEYQREAAAKLPTLVEGRDELQIEYDAAKAELDVMLDYYAR